MYPATRRSPCARACFASATGSEPGVLEREPHPASEIAATKRNRMHLPCSITDQHSTAGRAPNRVELSQGPFRPAGPLQCGVILPPAPPLFNDEWTLTRQACELDESGPKALGLLRRKIIVEAHHGFDEIRRGDRPIKRGRERGG